MTSLAFEPVETFAAVDEPGAVPLVVAAASTDELRAAVPAAGLVLVFGDAGAGKTTLLVDLVMHLVTGAEWCGVLAPIRPLRVAWIENEGPRPMMRAKFRAKLDRWTGGSIDGRLHVQTEPWAEFTFRDDSHRVELAAALDALKTDLLVVGPLGRIGMQGPGNTDEIREFLALVYEVQRRCDPQPAILIVHHENRAGQVSGAWEREPDLLVHVQGQGHGRTRVFWAKARWASDLHATSTHLAWADGESFTVEEKPVVTDDSIADDILAAVRELPGGSWTKIRDRVTGTGTETAKVRDRLLATGTIVNSAARDGYFNLWAADDPQAAPFVAANGLRTGYVRPDGATGPDDPFAVRRIKANGSGERARSVDDEDEIERIADLAREANA